MTLHSLPLFVRLGGRPVILLGDGEAADAKRRLLERAGAVVVGEAHPGEGTPTLAIVAIDDEREALAAIARLKARGILVNAVDRPDHCDFTLPAIVERGPVIVAVGTGGVSAGLAAALRQRLELLLPATLGSLATALHAARDALRARWPDGGARRRAIGAALAPGGTLDPLALDHVPADPVATMGADNTPRAVRIRLRSADPDDLTLREARWLAAADRVVHDGTAPPAILDRARADAARLVSSPDDAPGLSVYLENP
ncbi:NAD(P)-dependent oxidoreductase [Sphingomonas sp. KR1UV-12]|uniref:precorrin-2 dehydrogenase n=1 Tax=Sphingomonas aurea TaxID=3063994 RepID=A0ABT9EM56_9SPHN|nr:NAD(P)-dependent oxidoreductase [Sphingomonas sp. KR1UV-12]MDP1027907.1 NAD(P)-dependent oxidoreductase [Sphingomonas sp. KR1UV-12]